MKHDLHTKFVNEATKMSLGQKLDRIKTLQDQILKHADQRDNYIDKIYFGVARKLVDESCFLDEVHELRTLLSSVSYSHALLDRFQKSRRALVSFCKSGVVAEQLQQFQTLSEEERLELADQISSFHSQSFFGSMHHAVADIKKSENSNRSFTRSFSLNGERQSPIASLIMLSDAVIGTNSNANLFLNMVYHESCVHNSMYQLQQGACFGYLHHFDPLYADGVLRNEYQQRGMSAPFEIPSIYPNYLEERIAFVEAARFVNDLGYDAAFDEDNKFLLPHDPNRPFELSV